MNDFAVNFLTYESNTPVYYNTYASPYGDLVLMTTESGVCGLHFLEEPPAYYLQLAEEKLGEVPVLAPERTQAWWDCIQQATQPLPLVAQGTPFQISVWKALCTIPSGTTRSYQTIARQLGHTQGARAVGNAVANNFIGWLIPCHRVVRQNGQMGGYRWTVARKKAILAAEMHG
ncbi:MAG: methylated-DNA--[protein]-cysteine S-methyltransferase [Bacteroidota bacterium]